jgi:nitroreductase
MNAELESTETTVTPDALLTQLRWRYATKAFDPTHKIGPKIWAALEEALILSPSSFGLQPWQFTVVDTPELRKKLLPVSWGQKQIVDASHLVVFSIRKNLSPADVETFVKRISEVRAVPADSLKSYKDIMVGAVSRPKDSFDVNAWSSRQLYVAIGQFLTSAAFLGVDACPMEGIDAAKYDEILGLDKAGFQTFAVVTLGYRSPEDKYATTPKVRFNKSDILKHL